MRSDFLKKVGANDIKLAPTWRSGWDSNPRAIARKLISSQPRYDHFDTAAYIDSALLIKYQITEYKSSVYGKVLSKTPSGIGGFFGGQTGEQQDRPGTADKCGGALYFMPVVVV